MNQELTHWRECSSCKKEINFNSKYFECSVSTCTGNRTGYVFCSVSCWERHLPGARHRDAAAIEKVSPRKEQYAVLMKTENSGTIHPPATQELGRKIIPANQSPSYASAKKIDQEILVVVSKVKAYIKTQADMNVSDDIMDILSNRIRFFCDEAIKKAQSDGRKTVQEKDLR